MSLYPSSDKNPKRALDHLLKLHGPILSHQSLSSSFTLSSHMMDKGIHHCDLDNLTSTHSRWENMDFLQARITAWNCYHTHFINCFISQSQWHYLNLKHSTFERCVFVNVNFLCQGEVESIRFEGCKFLNTQIGVKEKAAVRFDRCLSSNKELFLGFSQNQCTGIEVEFENKASELEKAEQKKAPPAPTPTQNPLGRLSQLEL